MAAGMDEKGGKETEMNDSWLEVRHKIFHVNWEPRKGKENEKENAKMRVPGIPNAKYIS